MKELKRSRDDRMLAGVCGGIGRYFEIDANVIRLVWVVVTLVSIGFGLLAYLIAWLLIPEELPPAADPGSGGGGPVSTIPDTGTIIEVEPIEVR
ncbi:MAG: PspC domain-containing protein [Methanospirillum sp.]|nr:PspC domain-containing protein [Methanospirillum sp.]